MIHLSCHAYHRPSFGGYFRMTNCSLLSSRPFDRVYVSVAASADGHNSSLGEESYFGGSEEADGENLAQYSFLTYLIAGYSFGVTRSTLAGRNFADVSGVSVSDPANPSSG